jgi:hypothetical protein
MLIITLIAQIGLLKTCAELSTTNASLTCSQHFALGFWESPRNTEVFQKNFTTASAAMISGFVSAGLWLALFVYQFVRARAFFKSSLAENIPMASVNKK